MAVPLKNLFTPENILHVGQMRDEFFKTGNMEGISGVREEILMGWNLSYNSQFRKPYSPKPIVHNLDNHVRRSQNLLDVALPYMNKIYSFLDQESFWLTLLDDEGVIIKLVGSPAILKELAATGLTEGSDRGANVPYCGLFHLVYLLKKPFMLVSTEHASPIDDNLAGAASPIVDLRTQKKIGYLAISGHWWDSHIHTLGLAIVASEAISQQIKLKADNMQMAKMNKMVTCSNNRLTKTIENINSGLIYIDIHGNVKTINRTAIVLLGIKKSREEIIDTSIFPYLDNQITMDSIHKNTLDDATFQYDLSSLSQGKTMYHKRFSLYLFIKSILTGNDEEATEYVIQVCKQTSIHQTAMNIVYPHASFTFQDIIGQSPQIKQAKQDAAIAAEHDPSILILGESGTGKELLAQSIHNSSSRADGPFVAINCGAIPRSLIESELFGYEKGAFTGADRNGHPGKFELANGGTLFLDEIGDMPYDVQVTLLRVLQSKQVIRIGGQQPKKVDVRIISATNQDLESKIQNHTFRADLYYRLNVFTITLPALRERTGDIDILVQYFINVYNTRYKKEVQGVSSDTLRILKKYSWPGNIRELENVIERALIVCVGTDIETHDLPHKFQSMQQVSGKCVESVQSMSERENILAALCACDYNISHAAKYLGISRPTLYKKMNFYCISKHFTSNNR
ncbi:MAG: sigma 54-interacting transcriptional regulator [Megasphaera sp.]|jgi:transcriptional regulator with PAS, ATPase and Fis domain|nr:sigma 54-interacting transcriptional regulator [Megasphaera sp.]MCH4218053.1 sigma 54-interacting transcriptional regulator [Megasphaera sp.]